MYSLVIREAEFFAFFVQFLCFFAAETCPGEGRMSDSRHRHAEPNLPFLHRSSRCRLALLSSELEENGSRLFEEIRKIRTEPTDRDHAEILRDLSAQGPSGLRKNIAELIL